MAIKVCNPTLTINWDITKPNGQYRKDVSIDRMKNLCNIDITSLKDGIKKVYNEYDKTGI